MQPQPTRQDDAPHLHRLEMVLSEHYGRHITREDQSEVAACTCLFQQSNTSTQPKRWGHDTGRAKHRFEEGDCFQDSVKTPMVKEQMPKKLLH